MKMGFPESWAGVARAPAPACAGGKSRYQPARKRTPINPSPMSNHRTIVFSLRIVPRTPNDLALRRAEGPGIMQLTSDGPSAAAPGSALFYCFYRRFSSENLTDNLTLSSPQTDKL